MSPVVGDCLYKIFIDSVLQNRMMFFTNSDRTIVR